MKAAYLTGIRHIEIREKQKPEVINPEEVLVKIKVVTICGSDIHYFKLGRIGDQVINYPFIVGHECSGIIEKKGANVKSLEIGDKVAIDPAVTCDECDQCLTGRHNTCRNLKFLGCPGEMEGALQEYIIIPAKSCYKINSDTSLVDAALAEPLSIGIYSVKRAEINNNAKIGIFGFGPVGISVMLAAKMESGRKYYVIDKINERLTLAKKHGVKLALNFLSNTTYKQVLAIEKDGLDVVFECCGQQEAVREAINILKPGGKLVVIGIPEFDSWQYNASLIRRKEITIINIRRQNDCMKDALDLIESKKVNLQSLVTHSFDLSETAVAFNWVENYREGIIKAVINV